MSLTFLYGSTLWIATSVASAQLAFPSAFEQAARLADRAPAAAVASEKPTQNCPYCVSGDCILCGQEAFRMDYEGCGAYGGGAFAEPNYVSPADAVVTGETIAPRATEPDDTAEVAVAASGPDGDRGGILAALATAAEHAPGTGLVRKSLSAGAMEASRALALARQWLAGPAQVATVEPPPARTPTEASEKLREWFSSKTPSDIGHSVEAGAGEGLEANPQPAVTSHADADPNAAGSPESVAEIDSLVPSEAFPANADDAAPSVDWEAEVAKLYLDRLHAECGQEDAIDDGDPRHDVVTPTIRTAAFALESLGHAAIQLSGRLRNLAESTTIR